MTPVLPPMLQLDTIKASGHLDLRIDTSSPPDSPRLKQDNFAPDSPRSSNINKCPSCCKSVFQVEEVSCGGSYWHLACFKCGGPGESGCQRRLSPTDFNLHSSIPYCKHCYSRVLCNIKSSSDMEGADTIQGACSGSARSELPELLDIVKVEKRASIFGPSRRSSTIENNLALQNRILCPKCSKTVFKVEEVLATGLIWHQSCFQCGGVNDEVGCHRVLGREDFLQDRGIPFCKACFSRRITPKNFELLNTCTSSSLSKMGFSTEYSWEVNDKGHGDEDGDEESMYVINAELEKERCTNQIIRNDRYASILAALSDDEDEDEDEEVENDLVSVKSVRSLDSKLSIPATPKNLSPRYPNFSPCPSPHSPCPSPHSSHLSPHSSPQSRFSPSASMSTFSSPENSSPSQSIIISKTLSCPKLVGSGTISSLELKSGNNLINYCNY